MPGIGHQAAGEPPERNFLREEALSVSQASASSKLAPPRKASSQEPAMATWQGPSGRLANQSRAHSVVASAAGDWRSLRRWRRLAIFGAILFFFLGWLLSLLSKGK